MNEADSIFSNTSDFIAHLHTLRKNRLATKQAEQGIRKSLSQKQRQEIFARTNGHCHICGGLIDNKWVADHVLAHTYGGDRFLENYLPAHPICNRSKWFYGSEEFQWIMKIGIYFRTQLEEIGNPDAISLATSFMEHEAHRNSRRKTQNP